MKKTYIEKRPWGHFERFTENEQTTVKHIHVKPHSRLSLQYHNHREEYWRVITGQGEVIIGENTHPARPGDSFFIPKQTVHRIQTTDNDLLILEIAYGEFDEEDIVRIQDVYGRK